MSRRIGSATLCALLGLGLCLGTSPAKADFISLNTSPGLPAAGTADPNYTAAFFTNATIDALTTQPTGLVGGAPAPTAAGLPTGSGVVNFTPVAVGPNGTFPVQGGSLWSLNTSTSSWIGPNSVGASAGTSLPSPLDGFSSSNSSPQGYFYYDRSFSLTSTANVLQGGLWATDNGGIAIYLNGNLETTVAPNTGFPSFSSFSINPADLVAGTNHLTFVVFNENFSPAHTSPTGLRVEGAIVPEPASIALLGIGLSSVLAFRRLIKRRASA